MYQCTVPLSLLALQLYISASFLLTPPPSPPPLSGTDKNQLSPRCWEDISEIVNNCSSPDNCRLGLQRVQDTLSYLAHHFMEKRLFVQESLYDVLSHDYVDPIGQFLNMLCISMVTGFAESVETGNSTHEQG